MATKPLEASVRQEAHAAVISLRGEIDSFGEETLNKAYDAAEALGARAILLNFSGVDYINSTGIALNGVWVPTSDLAEAHSESRPSQATTRWRLFSSA